MTRSLRLAATLVMLLALSGCGAVTSPSPTLTTQLTVSLPIPTTDKAVVEAAIEVMSARLRALGVGTFSSSAGSNLTFMIPIDGTVDRTAIDAVLRSAGVVRVNGWSAADGDTPRSGDRAPTGGTLVFDAGQITSATVVAATPDSGQGPGIEVALDPEGAAALETWTTAHVGDALTIVVDGTVLDSAVVMSTIPDGRIVITFPTTTSLRPDVVAAVMAAGPLPDRWSAP